MVIREGVKTYRVSPATFKQVTERVMVKPETPKFEIVPAVYEEREAELAVEQARTVLEPCRAAGTAYSKGTGSMTFCAKEIPAKAKTVTVKAMIEPETTKVIYEPAEYKEITRWILDKPAQVVEVMESEQVIEVSALEVVSPEKTIQRVDPAVTETMDVRKFEGQARVVSRRAVCDSDLNERFIRQLQNSLVFRLQGTLLQQCRREPDIWEDRSAPPRRWAYRSQ